MFAENAEVFEKSLGAQQVSGLTALLDESMDHLTDNWDDHEGYYRARTAEILNDRYK
ncbi:hypothetical protein SARC_16882, partial [Sphaeroforma arctica JP610]